MKNVCRKIEIIKKESSGNSKTKNIEIKIKNTIDLIGD